MRLRRNKTRIDRSLFTARFKRDYIAYSAIVIFFFIVAAEVTLAIGIPSYLLQSDIWARQMQRQQMVQTFDTMRREVNRSEPRNENALQEVELIGWTLNMMADYLREERHIMPYSQVETLKKEFTELELFLTQLNQRGQPYNRPRELELTGWTGQLSDQIAGYQPQEKKD